MNIIEMHSQSWQQLCERRAQLPHALLIAGQRGIGKFELARSFAASLLCEARTESGSACGRCLACGWLAQGNHPDFRLLQPDALAEEDGDSGEAVESGGKKKPRVIGVENVVELQTWSRLVAMRDPATGRVLRKDGTVAPKGERTPVQDQMQEADKRRSGTHFRKLISELKAMGYDVEYRELTASDYGVPTTRKRLFILARCDGKPIVWPEVTHGNPKSLKVQAASIGQQAAGRFHQGFRLLDFVAERGG